MAKLTRKIEVKAQAARNKRELKRGRSVDKLRKVGDELIGATELRKKKAKKFSKKNK